MIVAVAGLLETRTGNIPLAWQLTIGGSGILLSGLTLYHTFAIPKPESDVPNIQEDSGNKVAEIFEGFGRTVTTYFKKPGVWLAIIFMLCYRLPEAFLIKMCTPFLVAAREAGGLGMQTAQVGIAYGTLGVIFLLLGGILGGLLASRLGLKKSIWIMAAFMTLPCLSFVYLAVVQPVSKFRHNLYLHRHRTVWLRLRIHRLHALHDVLLRRRVQDLALCLLHLLHGAEHDDTGHVRRLPAGVPRLQGLLLDGDCLLHSDRRRHLPRRPQDRS